jgi:phage shock protein E
MTMKFYKKIIFDIKGNQKGVIYMNKLKKFVLGLCGISFSLLSVTACSKAISFTNISPKDAVEILKGDSGAILIDVRTPEEFQMLRIPGSVLIPNYEIKEKVANIVPDKDTTVIVYCRSGNRSRQAAKELIDMGYTKVFDLGGIINWPYDTEGDEAL